MAQGCSELPQLLAMGKWKACGLDHRLDEAAEDV